MYRSAYVKLQSPGFEQYFVKESNIRFKRKQMIEKLEKRYKFITTDTQACGQILTNNPVYLPKRVNAAKQFSVELADAVSSLRKEKQEVLNIEDYCYAKTDQVRPFAQDEQMSYHESQITLLDGLIKKYQQVCEKLTEYQSKAKHISLPVKESEAKLSDQRKRTNTMTRKKNYLAEKMLQWIS